MASHFSLLFWGLLIVIVDITIGNLDLLADGVGFLVISAGCYGLKSQSFRFSTARDLCLVAAILWLVGFVIHAESSVIFSLFEVLLECAMFWFLLGGIVDFTLGQQRYDLAKRAKNYRLAYIFVTISSALLVLILQGWGSAGPAIAVLVVSMIVLMVMILHLIHRVEVECAR